MGMIFVLLIGMLRRYNETHVKVFEEERIDHDAMVDIGSESFGSKNQFKKRYCYGDCRHYGFGNTE
jgi:hypothetical protein